MVKNKKNILLLGGVRVVGRNRVDVGRRERRSVYRQLHNIRDLLSDIFWLVQSR